MVTGLSNSSSCGWDEVDANFLKLILQSIINPLRHLVNTSLMTKSFANKWRIAKVHPLLKDSELSRMEQSSYRPVSMLSTVSKIVERAAQIQLLQFLESSGQLNESAHAYRKGLGTATAIAEMSDKLYSATEEKLMTSIMTVDESSAFDCLNTEILLNKMRLYSVDEDVIDWLRSYLTFRTQYVTVGASNSRMRQLTRGVPQGSVLGPLLFAVYTNELTEVVRNKDCTDQSHNVQTKLFGTPCGPCGAMINYVDDSTYLVSSRSREANKIKMTKNMKNIRIFLRKK